MQYAMFNGFLSFSFCFNFFAAIYLFILVWCLMCECIYCSNELTVFDGPQLELKQMKHWRKCEMWDAIANCKLRTTRLKGKRGQTDKNEKFRKNEIRFLQNVCRLHREAKPEPVFRLIVFCVFFFCFLFLSVN